MNGELIELKLHVKDNTGYGRREYWLADRDLNAYDTSS